MEKNIEELDKVMRESLTCRLLVEFENGESLSEVSDPHEELSLICSELPNFLAALGEAGGGRRLQTWDWTCSQIRLNLRIFPERRMKVIA